MNPRLSLGSIFFTLSLDYSFIFWKLYSDIVQYLLKIKFHISGTSGIIFVWFFYFYIRNIRFLFWRVLLVFFNHRNASFCVNILILIELLFMNIVEAEINGCSSEWQNREASEGVSDSKVINNQASNKTSSCFSNSKVQCTHNSLWTKKILNINKNDFLGSSLYVWPLLVTLLETLEDRRP